MAHRLSAGEEVQKWGVNLNPEFELHVMGTFTAGAPRSSWVGARGGVHCNIKPWNLAQRDLGWALGWNYL